MVNKYNFIRIYLRCLLQTHHFKNQFVFHLNLQLNLKLWKKCSYGLLHTSHYVEIFTLNPEYL